MLEAAGSADEADDSAVEAEGVGLVAAAGVDLAPDGVASVDEVGRGVGSTILPVISLSMSTCVAILDTVFLTTEE